MKPAKKKMITRPKRDQICHYGLREMKLDEFSLPRAGEATCYAEGRRGHSVFLADMAWDLGLLRVRLGHLAEKVLNEAWACRFQYKGFRFQSQSESWPHYSFRLLTTCMFWQTGNLSTMLLSVTCGLMSGSLHDVQHDVVNMWGTSRMTLVVASLLSVLSVLGTTFILGKQKIMFHPSW